MAVSFLSLKDVTALHGEEISQAVQRVVESGWYLQGYENAEFERRYAEYIGTQHCIGCANGLDALTLMLRGYMEMGRLKPGDEIIVPANTYIATILAITENHLTPVLVEPSIETLQIDDDMIERHITQRTRGVMIVHLYGFCAYTERIAEVCRRNGLLLFEDNAQAHGCVHTATGQRTGSLGDAAAHSFYPGKNLGALGDGGAVTTDDAELAAVIRTLANYGSSRRYVFPYRGRNSRLDELQAAVLNVKLKHLDEDNARRRVIADYYLSNLPDSMVTADGMECDIRLPRTGRSAVWHIFPVLVSPASAGGEPSAARDALQRHLGERGIQTLIHYPIPPHRQECYREWNNLSLPITERIAQEELSLPMSPAMTLDDAREVVEKCY